MNFSGKGDLYLFGGALVYRKLSGARRIFQKKEKTKS